MRLEPVETEHRKNNALARVQSVLFAEGAPGRPAKLDDSVRFLSSPGESLEAVEIARLVLDEAARGVRFQEMAVLLHEPAAYTAHLASAFDRAGIPAFFVDGFPTGYLLDDDSEENMGRPICERTGFRLEGAWLPPVGMAAQKVPCSVALNLVAESIRQLLE